MTAKLRAPLAVRIAFTDFWHPETQEEVRANPLYRLLESHFALELSENPDFLVYSCFGRRHLKFKCTRIFYTGENVRPDFDRCDHAFSFDYPVTDRNYRLPLYRLYDNYERFDSKGLNLPIPAEQKFCNFLYSNPRAHERLDFLERLSQYRSVDCGGKLRNNIGRRVKDKLSFLSQYKFTIAFENSSHPGYTTEKLLEALISNTIPIYWGNPLVARDFNSDAFVNCHDYDNFDRVVARVAEIDQDDSLYTQMLRAPVFRDGRENEYVRRDNILQRFEKIFTGRQSSRTAKPVDTLRYYLGGADVLRHCRRLARTLRT